MTTIDVCFVTWPITPERIAAFHKCVTEWTERLTCDKDDVIGWYCSTETGGCTQEQLDTVRDICGDHDITLRERQETPDQGSNLNIAMRMSDGDFLIMVMDDFHLASQLNVSPHCRFLAERPEVATIRYGWQRTLFMDDIPGTDLRFTDKSGPYPYATEPSLWRANWEAEFGPWREHAGYAGPENSRCHEMRHNDRPVVATTFLYAKWDHTLSTRPQRMDGQDN